MADAPPLISQVVGPHAFTYEALFRQADPLGRGVIKAAEAAKFLKQSGLKQSVLSQIWELSDKQKKGYLDKQGFCIALKLIALVQNGLEANMSNITKPVSIPNMGTSNVAVAANSTEWIIKNEEKAKYDKIFNNLGPVNGLLPGSKIKPVLLNSKLAVDVLGQIWNLSDMDNDGSLDQEEFAVAMHLVYKALEKVPMPDTLPSEVIPPGKRTLRRRCSSGSNFAPANRPVARSGSLSGITSAGAGLPRAQHADNAKWVVSSEDKARYDNMFARADTDQDGFVSGAEIKSIFLKSGLQQATLAHIWSLCDYRRAGKLNPDQFALAMHLVAQKLKGVEPPEKLPPNMITPLIRRRSLVDGMIPPGMSVDYSSSGVQELDTLGTELEKLRRRKLEVEQEKQRVEGEAKGLGLEVKSVQTELETVAAAVKQIELQKREAQKRLDDLDKKKCKLDAEVKQQDEAYIAGEKRIEELKEELKSEQEKSQNADEDMKRKRDELNALRQQELDVELKVEGSHRKLVHLAKLLHGTQLHVKQMEKNIGELEEARKSMLQTINLYDALFAGEISEEQALQTGSLTSPTSIDISLFSIDSMNDIMNMSNEELDELRAKLSVDFNGIDDVLDEDIEGGDDPFGEALTTVETNTKAQEPEEDWTTEFGSKRSAGNDPFAVGFITELKSPVNPEDPFGTGTFVVEGNNKTLYPGGKPPRPKSPGGPPRRPEAPPQRPKSPQPPERPKSPNVGPERPRSPNIGPERPKSPVAPGRPRSPVPPHRPSALPSSTRSPTSDRPPQRPPVPKSPLKQQAGGDSDSEQNYRISSAGDRVW